MPQRITVMAAVAGLIAVLLGILPTAQSRVGNAGNDTAAFDAVVAVSTTMTELLPLGILMLAAGAILYSIGVLN